MRARHSRAGCRKSSRWGRTQCSLWRACSKQCVHLSAHPRRGFARVLVYCCDFDLACGRLQGHVPGSSLSDLKEESLRSKQQAYYASFFASERNQSGAKLSATSQANLLARAGRAKGMHRP